MGNAETENTVAQATDTVGQAIFPDQLEGAIAAPESVMPTEPDTSLEDTPGVIKDGAPEMETPPTAVEATENTEMNTTESPDESPISISEAEKPWNADALMAEAKKIAKKPETQAEAVSDLASMMQERAMKMREKVVTGKGALGELGRMWAKLDADEQDKILTKGLGVLSGMLQKAKEMGKNPGTSEIKKMRNIATRSIGGRIPVLKKVMVRMSKFSTEELQAYAALGVLKCKNPATAAKIDSAASTKLWLGSKAVQVIALLTGVGAEAVPVVQVGEKAGQSLTAQLPKIRANVLAAHPEPEVTPGIVTQMKDTAVDKAKEAVSAVRRSTHDAKERVMAANQNNFPQNNQKAA